MVRHTLKVLQHLLQDFKSVSQHFMTLRLSHFMTLRLRLFLPFIEPKKMLGISLEGKAPIVLQDGN